MFQSLPGNPSFRIFECRWRIFRAVGWIRQHADEKNFHDLQRSDDHTRRRSLLTIFQHAPTQNRLKRHKPDGHEVLKGVEGRDL